MPALAGLPLTAWEALGEPYPQARQRCCPAAEAALAGGADRDVASSALQRAAVLARGLGAARLLADITVLARRARIRWTRPVRGRPAQPRPPTVTRGWG